MKKIVLLSVLWATMTLQAGATHHTVAISGFTYVPALLTVNVGDTVTISATSFHPLLQVSRDTWNAGGNTALSGGFGPATSDYTFTAMAPDTLYYICMNHYSIGMKGRIAIQPSSGTGDIPLPSTGLRVYPNPAVRQAMIEFTAPSGESPQVLILNIAGQTEKDLTSAVFTGEGRYYCAIPADRLPVGEHLVMVIAGGRKWAEKFQVTR